MAGMRLAPNGARPSSPRSLRLLLLAPRISPHPGVQTQPAQPGAPGGPGPSPPPRTPPPTPRLLTLMNSTCCCQSGTRPYSTPAPTPTGSAPAARKPSGHPQDDPSESRPQSRFHRGSVSQVPATHGCGGHHPTQNIPQLSDEDGGKERRQGPGRRHRPRPREKPPRASVEWLLPQPLTCAPSSWAATCLPLSPPLANQPHPEPPLIPQGQGSKPAFEAPPPTSPPAPQQAQLLRHPLPRPWSFHPPSSSLHPPGQLPACPRSGEQPSARMGQLPRARSPHPYLQGEADLVNAPWLRPRQTPAPAQSQGIRGDPRPWPEGMRRARAR